MRRALIVASGLRGVTGHNFFYTQTVKRELESRGFEVTVFVNKNAPADLIAETGFTPVFSLGTYDAIPLNGKVADLRYVYLQAGLYAFELEAAVNRLENSDFELTFFHTVADFELIALNRFLKRNRLSGHLFVLERLTPRFTELKTWKRYLHPFWRMKPRYLNSLHRRMRRKFTLLTDSELLTNDYTLGYRHRIVTAPIPLEGSFSEQSATIPDSALMERYGLAKTTGIDFGYMGDSREGKGFSLLAPMIERVLEQDPSRSRFIVQCAVSEYEFQENTSIKELKRVSEKFPSRVFLINERLSEADYMALFRFLNVVLIPYTGAGFVEGTSNVYSEAAALGKPVVVSDNTWMANELKKYFGGVEFKIGDSIDFAEKVLEVNANFDELSTRARTFAPSWNQFHSAENLVDMLLKELQTQR
jgi:glycosyltransferase involved in cell wall biosynthesis